MLNYKCRYWITTITGLRKSYGVVIEESPNTDPARREKVEGNALP